MKKTAPVFFYTGAVCFSAQEKQILGRIGREVRLRCTHSREMPILEGGHILALRTPRVDLLPHTTAHPNSLHVTHLRMCWFRDPRLHGPDVPADGEQAKQGKKVSQGAFAFRGFRASRLGYSRNARHADRAPRLSLRVAFDEVVYPGTHLRAQPRMTCAALDRPEPVLDHS